MENNNHNDPHTQTIAETDNFLAWKAEEPDGDESDDADTNPAAHDLRILCRNIPSAASRRTTGMANSGQVVAFTTGS